MTLIDILNDQDLRGDVDSIDDLASSLDGREDDKNLRPMYDAEVSRLAAKTGFTYDPLGVK